MFGAGTWGRAGGVYLALNVDWSLVSVPLAWTYRAVAPGTLPWRVCLRGGFAVGAFIAGFLQGFVLFWSLPIDLGVLVGWVATREAVAEVTDGSAP